jgi:Fur family ferric uptake transcriptional regulator
MATDEACDDPPDLDSFQNARHTQRVSEAPERPAPEVRARGSEVGHPELGKFEPMLRQASVRVTRPRLAVLATVHALPHADTESIIRSVRRELPGVSHQTVYDVLGVLSACGLLRRIQPAGSVARYEARVGDNHHHVVCRSCGAIADVDCAVGDTPCLTASHDRGFSIDEAEVNYWGLCPECLGAHQAS